MTQSIKKPYVYNGVIYLIIFGSLTMYILFELLLCSLGSKDKTRQHYSRKVWFHILMLMFTLFESIYSVSLIVHNGDIHDSKWGFIFHTLASYLHVLVFGLTVNFWKQSLHDISPSRTVGIIVLGVNGVVTLVTVLSIICKY